MNDTYHLHGENINLATDQGRANQGAADRLPSSPPPRDLPALDSHFLGRDNELAYLLANLRPGKVITVCGPGGMGKSALAAQAADQLEMSRFPDGILFHSFYNQPDTGAALAYIAEAFGREASPSQAAAARRALAGKKALLILDGAEEADDLKAVLDLRGSCGVLITSRRRQDCPDKRLDLQPLASEAAAQLLRAWIGGESESDQETLERICTRLGNWPVALRIAGRYLSRTDEQAEEYLEWLVKEPFKELGEGNHAEENAALLLKRSLEQVSEDARLVLGLFGALAFTPLSREPVRAVLDDDIRRGRSAINSLVNFGLLVRDDERWQTSHALVHSYARTELPLNDERLKRLAAYYIRFCEEQSKAGLPGYARLDKERAHCLRLIATCLKCRLHKEVSALVKAIDIYLDLQGHWTELLAAVKMNLTAAQQAGDRRDEGGCLNILGLTSWKCGEYMTALEYCEQSLIICREVSDKYVEGQTRNNIATIYNAQGDYAKALEQYEQSLKIRREIGYRKGEGVTLNNISQVYMSQGKPEQALQYLKKALPLSQEAGDKVGEGATLNNIARIYAAQGDPAKALQYWEQALVIKREVGDRAGEAVTCWNIGLTYQKQGDLSKSEKYINDAVRIEEEIGHPQSKAWRTALEQIQAQRRDR